MNDHLTASMFTRGEALSVKLGSYTGKIQGCFLDLGFASGKGQSVVTIHFADVAEAIGLALKLERQARELAGAQADMRQKLIDKAAEALQSAMANA